jgi:hypothetical protein
MFFAMMIMFFIFMRLAFGRRHRFARLQCHSHHYHRQRRAPVQAPPEPSPFERLKQQYVDGDLSDEQYEEELDKLIRGGRSGALDIHSAGASTRA